VEWSDWPAVSGPPPVRQGRSGAAPGVLKTPDVLRGEAGGELFSIGDTARVGAHAIVELPKSGKSVSLDFRLFRSSSGLGSVAFNNDFRLFLDKDLQISKERRGTNPAPDLRKSFDPTPRQKRQFDQLVAFTQKLWRDSDAVRKEFWKKADT